MENVRILKTESDFNWALKEVETYFDELPQPGSAGADRFELLTALINAYEARNWPLPEVDPIEFLKGFMQNRNYSRRDLADVLGSESRATEILNRKRPLTLAMIQKLNAEWGMPADALIQPYELGKTAE